jgi:hypothetical protein
MKNHRKIIEQLLSPAGVWINNPDPWDIQVRDKGFYARVPKDGSLGLADFFVPGMFNFGKSSSRSMASPEAMKRFGEVRS